MLRSILIIGAATILVAACTAKSGSGASGAPDSAVPSDAASSGPGTGGGSSLPSSITDPILVDAAGRLGVDPSAVTIVSGLAQTFSDGSLGCPEPGMMYTQALVDGYQVVVEAGGTRLDYRGRGPGQFRVCANP
jgi:hypothetical protein